MRRAVVISAETDGASSVSHTAAVHVAETMEARQVAVRRYFGHDATYGTIWRKETGEAAHGAGLWSYFGHGNPRSMQGADTSAAFTASMARMAPGAVFFITACHTGERLASDLVKNGAGAVVAHTGPEWVGPDDDWHGAFARGFTVPTMSFVDGSTVATALATAKEYWERLVTTATVAARSGDKTAGHAAEMATSNADHMSVYGDPELTYDVSQMSSDREEEEAWRKLELKVLARGY